MNIGRIQNYCFYRTNSAHAQTFKGSEDIYKHAKRMSADPLNYLYDGDDLFEGDFNDAYNT